MGEADIGIRVFLDDAASQGLYAIDSTLGRIGTNLISADGGMRKFTGSLAALGVLTGFAASLVLFGGALKASVDAATDFQQSMFNVAVATHVPMDVAMQYSNKLMNLAATSTYTSKEIADGIVTLGRSGYSLKEIMNGMAEAGIALGIATRSDATEGFKLLAQTMVAYHAPAEQAMHYADMLQFAFEHQTGTVSQLQSALAAVTYAAVRLNTPFQEVAAALDVVGPAMGNTSMAGTSLRYALANITSPSAQALKALADIGLVTVSSTNPAVVDLSNKLLLAGAASTDFVRKNDTSVVGLKNLFTTAQQAGIIPLDTKFEEWAMRTHAVNDAFFDAKGNAKDFSTDLQLLADKTKHMNSAELSAFLKDVFSTKGGAGIQILLQQLPKYFKDVEGAANNSHGAMKRWDEVMKTFGGAWAGLKSSITDFGIAIGIQLLPALTNAATWLNNFITGIRNSGVIANGGAAGFLKLGAALSGLGIVGTIIGMAFAGILPPILMFAGIAIGVTAATIALTFGIIMLVNWFKQTAASVSPMGSILRGLTSIVRDLGTYLISQGAQAWQRIQQAMAPLGPAFQQLLTAIRPAFPIFGLLAMVIGAMLVGALHGVISALAMFITGIAHVLIGVVQVVTGIITFVAGFLTLLHGLFTLNGAQIQQGWTSMWNGIKGIAQGVLSIITGLFYASWGTLLAAVDGFVHGVINFFSHLQSVLVGHSIVPDMMNAIRNVIMNGLQAAISFVMSFVSNTISHFLQMGAQVVSVGTNAFNMFRAAVQAGINAVLSIVTSLPGRVVSLLAGLGGMLFSSGASAMQQFANGLASTIGSVIQQVQNASQTIANFLAHHSPAKYGPLADDDQWMPRMMKMMASGIDEHTPLLAQAAARAAGGIASAPGTARLGAPVPGFGAGGASGGNITVPLVVDGNTIGQVVINRLTGQMQMNGFSRSFR